MVVEQNCKYIQNEKEYLPGEEIPTIQIGDIYVCGDFEYKYNYKASLLNDYPWLHNEQQCGWGVRTIDKTKESYGSILCEINNFPVTSLHNTFYNCVNLTTAPEIPHTIVDLWGTFSGCESLICSPTIPNSVQKMQWAFEYCEKLQNIPSIPSHITDLTGTFADCVSLKQISIDSNIKTPIQKIFINCPTLKLNR